VSQIIQNALGGRHHKNQPHTLFKDKVHVIRLINDGEVDVPLNSRAQSFQYLRSHRNPHETIFFRLGGCCTPQE
jgi:hypothetical protein